MVKCSDVPSPVSVEESLQNILDYWRKFKGKNVGITVPSGSPSPTPGTEYEIVKEIIEGTVDIITSYPLH